MIGVFENPGWVQFPVGSLSPVRLRTGFFYGFSLLLQGNQGSFLLGAARVPLGRLIKHGYRVSVHVRA